MSKLIIQIDSPESIAQLNSEVQEIANNPEIALQKLIRYFRGAIYGENNGITVQVTTRDTTVLIGTSGTESQQNIHSI